MLLKVCFKFIYQHAWFSLMSIWRLTTHKSSKQSSCSLSLFSLVPFFSCSRASSLLFGRMAALHSTATSAAWISCPPRSPRASSGASCSACRCPLSFLDWSRVQLRCCWISWIYLLFSFSLLLISESEARVFTAAFLPWISSSLRLCLSMSL